MAGAKGSSGKTSGGGGKSGKGKLVSREKQVQIKRIGQLVMYAGFADQKCVCGKTWRRGMCSKYNDTYYCSESCVVKVANA